MSNIQIKKINDESFSSVALYLDYVLSITKEMGVPYFIWMNDTRYFVTRVSETGGLLYAVSYEKDGKMKVFGLSVPTQNKDCVSITDGVTIYRDFSTLPEYPFVMKENIVNDNKEQLTIGQQPDGSNCLIYFQDDVVNNLDCEIMYNINGFEKNLAAYLNYIDVKFPRSVVIGENTKLLKVINWRKQEIFRYHEANYVQPIIRLFGNEIANVSSAVDKDDVLYNVRENGFKSCAPKDMCDMFVHKSEVENNMKVLAKIYDDNLMKIN